MQGHLRALGEHEGQCVGLARHQVQVGELEHRPVVLPDAGDGVVIQHGLADGATATLHVCKEQRKHDSTIRK